MDSESWEKGGMGFRVVGIAVGLVLLSLFTTQAAAQNVTRYVSEELEVGVRTGKTMQNRIIRSARSGEQVTVLQQDADGHSQIRFANGTEAWILTRYLQDEPHSRERLAAVQAELDEIRSGSDDQAGRVAQLLDVRRTLEAERDTLQQQLASLESELEQLRDVAARPQEIRAQNEQLRSSLLEAQNSAEDYRREVEVMRADNQRKWFMTGALVTVGSLLLGMLFTRVPRRRRSSEW
jgi:SH3 domain protein